MYAQIIKNNVVVNVIAVDPGAVLSSDGSKITWTNGEFDAPVGSTLTMQAAAGIGWTLSGAVLVAPAVAAPTQADLIAYAETLRGKIAAGGISVNIAPSGATPQMVEVGTDAAGLALLANAVQLTSTAPGTTYDWDQDAPVTLTGAQIIAIQVAVGLWMQQLFAEKSAIRAAIAAGTITTTAQIDDPTTVGINAWPSNS